MVDDVDREGDSQLDLAAHNSAVKLAAEQLVDSQASEWKPDSSQDSSSSEDTEEGVDFEALSQEFEDSEESPDANPKKRDKDGSIKVSSMAAKKRLELEDKENVGGISALHPPGAGPTAKSTGGGGPAANGPLDQVIDDPRKDPNMPHVSNNGAIAIGMFTLWRQVRMGANPPADNETCHALREELIKHGMKPKAKASKPELVVWVKTCWRVWRRCLIWRRGVIR